MILIVGSQHDDILYFESVMSNKKQELVLGQYPVTVGTIFNQGVVLVDQIKTNYVSSALVLHLIEKYFIFLVFNVGRCIAFTKDVKPLEIAVSQRVVAGDVDQINEDNVKFAQIPGFEQVFNCQNDIIGYLSDAFEKRTFSKIKLPTNCPPALSVTRSLTSQANCSVCGHAGYHLFPRVLSDGYCSFWAFQVALVAKNPPAKAGDLRDASSIPRF